MGWCRIGDKPLPEPMIIDDQYLWHHMALLGHNGLTYIFYLQQGPEKTGGDKGGGDKGDWAEKKKKETILDLSKYLDKPIRVKFSGGREGKVGCGSTWLSALTQCSLMLACHPAMAGATILVPCHVPG